MRALLFLLPSLLLATVNEPFRAEVFTGYRNDRIHFHLNETTAPSNQTYSEIDRNVQFWQNGLTFKTIQRDITFFLRGSYSAFGSGEASTQNASLPNTHITPQYTFSTQGWAADVSGYLGYAVDLTPMRLYKVILTPLIGYSGYFESLSRSNPTPKAPSLDTFSLSLPHTLSLTWNGFQFGVGLFAKPSGYIRLNAGYCYNLLHNSTKTTLQTTYQDTTTTTTIDSTSSGNGGQSGWAQIDFLLPKEWRIGFGSHINYFSTRTTTINTQTPQNLKLRQTMISGWLQISKEL